MTNGYDNASKRIISFPVCANGMNWVESSTQPYLKNKRSIHRQFKDIIFFVDGKEALGTIGVVSESADVDSAVDVFLTSSKQVEHSF